MDRMLRNGRVFVVAGMNYELWRQHVLRVSKGARLPAKTVRKLIRHSVYLNTVRCRSGRANENAPA